MKKIMPKRKQLSHVNSASSGEDHVGESSTWHNMVTALKTKLRRSRTGSINSEQHALPPDFSIRSKSATLPSSIDRGKGEGRSKPHTLYWMVGVVDELEDSLNENGMVTIKNDSDESVDSGFHPLDETDDIVSLKRGSPVIAKSFSHSDSPSPFYDKAAVEKAFGPMKDVGRWYSSYQHEQEDRYIHRPMAPIPLQTLEEEEQRLTSRPLPPIPRDPQVLARPPPSLKSDEDIVYEHIQYKMQGSNGLALDLRSLAQHGWYWGPITRLEAEEHLAGTKDGTFLVRDSSNDRYLLSLSFHSQGKTLHTRIEYCNGNFSFYSFPDADTEGYSSVVELIQRSMQYSRDGVFCFSRARAAGSPALPVRLLKPFSRYNHVRTLQHYCRFVIRQSIRFDRIRQLPLPRHVHGYLEQSQF